MMVAVRVRLEPDVGVERIDDHEARPEVLDGSGEGLGPTGQVEPVGQDLDPPQVGAGGLETGAQHPRGVVLGRADDHDAARARDPRREVGSHDRGFPLAGPARHQGQHPRRDEPLPHPGDGLGADPRCRDGADRAPLPDHGELGAGFQAHHPSPPTASRTLRRAWAGTSKASRTTRTASAV